MVQTAFPSPQVQTPIGPGPSASRKVLIIDREEDSREMMAALEAQGFKVIQARDSAAGLSKAADPGLSLIVIGEQLVAGCEPGALPRLSAISASPVVLLHSGGQGVRAQAKNIGAEVYFNRTGPLEYFIHYVCGRLNWLARAGIAA
jgi:hypothetical protein